MKAQFIGMLKNIALLAVVMASIAAIHELGARYLFGPYSEVLSMTFREFTGGPDKQGI